MNQATMGATLPPLAAPAHCGQFRMAGTERTGEYGVIAITPLGRVGVREYAPGRFRVRLEPKVLLKVSDLAGWKQPGDDGQRRYSTVVSAAGLEQAVLTALRAIQVDDLAVFRTPELQDYWLARLTPVAGRSGALRLVIIAASAAVGAVVLVTVLRRHLA